MQNIKDLHWVVFVFTLIVTLSIVAVSKSAGAATAVNQDVYLPIIMKAQPHANPNFKFSIAGARTHQMDDINPLGSNNHIDPYAWGAVPNPTSDIQNIRRCFATGTGYQGWCWNRTTNQMVTNASTYNPTSQSLATWAAANPGKTWLIGNEPGNTDETAGDNMTRNGYARFFMDAATTIKTADPTAKLAFCQGRSVLIKSFCEDAYFELKALLAPSGRVPKDLIDIWAIHHYYWGNNDTNLGGTDQLHLDYWRTRVGNYPNWVNSIDGGALNGIPLYMTEYGDFFGDCPSTSLPMRSGIDHVGGVPCTSTNDTFYGRNNNEGYWGIHTNAAEFFLSAENTQWEAAWFFFSGCNSSTATHNIGGVFDVCPNATTANPNPAPTLNRNGIMYRDTLDCVYNNQNCPATLP